MSWTLLLLELKQRKKKKKVKDSPRFTELVGSKAKIWPRAAWNKGLVSVSAIRPLLSRSLPQNRRNNAFFIPEATATSSEGSCVKGFYVTDSDLDTKENTMSRASIPAHLGPEEGLASSPEAACHPPPFSTLIDTSSGAWPPRNP